MDPYEYQLSALRIYYRHSILTNVPILELVTLAQMINKIQLKFFIWWRLDVLS